MKTVLSMLFVAAVLLFSTAANAQEPIVSAKVPFSFMVGAQVYPAGEYTITKAIGSPALQIINKAGTQSTLVLSVACASPKNKRETTLVFERTGHYYSLRRIWLADKSFGLQLLMGHAEAILAQKEGPGETVVVAASPAR